MKALVLHGKNEPLLYEDVGDPVPGAGEVVVQIKAAALNHRDLWIKKGLYAGLKFPIVLGSDGFGQVISVGEGVDQSLGGMSVIINPSLNWGDRVEAQDAKFKILGLPDDGTLAERVKVPASAVVAAPKHLTPEQAAALPLAGLTAYRTLFTRCRLRAGERVLVTGVGGGVALIALQFAVAAGAHVSVTSGADDKIARAVGLGAGGGVNYKKSDWVEALKALVPGGFDVIIDSAGGPGFSNLVELASPGGRIAFFGATLGNPPEVDLRRIFWKQISLLGSTMGSPEEFADMVSFVGKHNIVPLADKVFPLMEGNAAFAAMDKAEQFGKIVVVP
ncbi:alcohol dehydrogenase [Verrucomicrobia bacterium SCGC AG-212-E04]|nr:alcohol dehydrogenase [Verrucomicrobia bacterium SCGC AG-212-E04]